MGSSLTVYNDVKGIGHKPRWTDRGFQHCEDIGVADAEFQAKSLAQCKKFCTDLTYSVLGQESWECGHIYWDDRSRKCEIFEGMRTCGAKDRTPSNNGRRMHTMKGYRAETVFVKCGPHWDFMWKAIANVLSIGIAGGLGLVGMAAGTGFVAAVAGLGKAAAAIGAAGIKLRTPVGEQASIPREDLIKISGMLKDFRKLEAGQEMPKLWGTLSLLQECQVIRSNGKIFKNAVYTGKWANSNNRYEVKKYFGGLGNPPLIPGATGKLSSQYKSVKDHGGQRAFDGSFKTMAHSLSEKNPWLQGDLGSRKKVEGVIIVNRPGDCKSRLLKGNGCDKRVTSGPGAIIRVSDKQCTGDSCPGVECGPRITKMTKNNAFAVNCPVGTMGRYVSLLLPGNNRYLNIMEMQIRGRNYADRRLEAEAFGDAPEPETAAPSPIWLLPEEPPASDEEERQNAVVDLLVGNWNPEVFSACDARQDLSCRGCVPCLACVENGDMSEECELCENMCTQCIPELPCLVEYYVDDAKHLLGENLVAIPSCLDTCKSCLSGDAEDCVGCEGCEGTIKGTADLLIFEAENRLPVSLDLWDSQQANELVAPTNTDTSTDEDRRRIKMIRNPDGTVTKVGSAWCTIRRTGQRVQEGWTGFCGGIASFYCRCNSKGLLERSRHPFPASTAMVWVRHFDDDTCEEVPTDDPCIWQGLCAQDCTCNGSCVPPVFTCDTTASLEEACREAALARGLKVPVGGGTGADHYAFAGDYKTKGCYYYTFGPYTGRAYFGRKQNGSEPSGSKLKLGTFCDP